LPPDKKTAYWGCNPKKLILILPLQLVNKQSVSIRFTMIYGTRLSTKFCSLHCVQYCKNNFNTIEHVAIKQSNTVLYVGVISQEVKWGSQRTLQVKIKWFATVENSLATSVGPGEILEYQYLS
jgi:hypothetical protein